MLICLELGTCLDLGLLPLIVDEKSSSHTVGCSLLFPKKKNKRSPVPNVAFECIPSLAKVYMANSGT